MQPRPRSFRRAKERARAEGRSLLALSILLALPGCGAIEQVDRPPPPALVHAQMAGTALGVAEGAWTHLPVPPEDGPALAPLAMATPIFARPDVGAEPIGYLRIGERVARSEQAVSTRGCGGGWYAVRPLGFVCNDDKATLKLDHPIVRAFPRGPDRDKPLPYKYAFVRAVAPNYLKVPSKEDQLRYEMHLERHLKSYARLGEQWDKMAPGANEVRLSPTGAAAEFEAGWMQPPTMNERYGGAGDDQVPWWLDGERRIPNLSAFRAPSYAVIAGRIKRHAGVALIDSFLTDERSLGRRFAIAADGRLLPADKLKAESASSFHGFELGELGLPVGIVSAEGVKSWDLEGAGARPIEPVERRRLVALTGEIKERAGVRFVRTRQGTWLRSNDLKIAVAPSTLPWFAKRKTRWIDISILSQTLVLYEGARPVYVTMISSGRDGLADPEESFATPTGVFRIYQKHVTHTMDSSAADNEFELRDVPWVMYFKGGYALHAAYWHDDFGRPRSHGCVNLAPIDARYVFNWSTPDVPDDWHGAYATESLGKGTLVNIHP